MKLNELRIGNYVNGLYFKHDDIEEKESVEKCKILGLDSVGFSEHKIWVEGLENTGIEVYESFEPILLTEQWLLDFGWVFNIEADCYEYTKEFDARMFLNYKEVNNSFNMFNYILNSNICKNIKHVHQLQNLYFTLTNKELVL